VQQLRSGVQLVTDRRFDGHDREILIAHSRQTGSKTLIAGQAIGRAAGGAVTRLDTYGAGASFDETAGALVGPPNRVQVFGYDGNARLSTEKEYRGAELLAFLGNANSPATSDVTYSYDAVGNRIGKVVVTPSGTESTAYAYDQNDRLIAETLTTTTGSTVTTNRTWDSNGNLASKTDPVGYTGYSFDAENRLVEVRKGSSAATATWVARYAYDADGQRVGKTTPAGTTRFLIDPTTEWPQVAVETSGSQRVAYVWGDVLRQQISGLAQAASTDGAGERLVALGGHLGTALAAIDSSGAVTEQYNTTAWGELANTNPALKHQFTGEYWDNDLGATYLRARWLDSRSGRLIAPDRRLGSPGSPASQHRYAYADGDPVQNLDPSGHTVMIGLNLNISLGALTTVSANIARVTANRIAGKALETFVEAQLQRFVAQYGGTVLRQVYFKGPGGVRFADFVVKVGQRFVAIETKTKIPMSGSSLVRLGGQLKTFISGASGNPALAGTATEVIVITEESVVALEAAFVSIEAQVSAGTISGILQGTTGLMTALRGILIGL